MNHETERERVKTKLKFTSAQIISQTQVKSQAKYNK